MSRRLVAAAAVLDDLNAPTRLLAARRNGSSRLAGGWELPGGKVEPGEEPQAALHRELAEELGVVVRLGAEVARPCGSPWVLDARHEMRCWTAQIISGEAQPLDEHDSLEWLTARDWASVAWLPGDVPVVKAVLPLLG